MSWKLEFGRGDGSLKLALQFAGNQQLLLIILVAFFQTLSNTLRQLVVQNVAQQEFNVSHLCNNTRSK